MVLTAKHLMDHIRHTLGGGDLSSNIDAVGILNQAGEHLHSMHTWKWAEGRTALLDLRGTITGTAATWTNSTLTLTLASSFTDYTFVEGDEIQITSGTDVTAGFYTVASRTSANAIVLSESIGTNSTDVAFTLQPYSIDLPDDVRDIIAIQGSNSLEQHITLTSKKEVLEVRERSEPNNVHWYAAISYVGSPPTPILEIAPGAGANETGAFRLFYRSRWAHMTADDTQIDVPTFVEALFVQIVRAFARGYEREDAGSLDARLTEIERGPVFRSAKRSDGNIQPNFGKLRGGGPTVWRKRLQGDWHETVTRISGPV
jgi:hypothetical protein